MTVRRKGFTLLASVQTGRRRRKPNAAQLHERMLFLENPTTIPQDAALGLLASTLDWLAVMAADNYDCSCEAGDVCPLCRCVSSLQAAGVSFK
jgi:hypothetical protein